MMTTTRKRPIVPVTSPDAPERRARVRVDVPCRVHMKMTDPATGEVLRAEGIMGNLSTGGTFVVCDRLFPAEAECQLDFSLHDGIRAHTVSITAWVAHVQDNGMGFQFDPPDAVTRTVLQRVVNRALYKRG